ncbi:MAG: DNA mismatch repair protein MutS [Elusimicrobia bacterium]|nr:DNA mismatch repair protein MutS [Elusimicrobiota bacterium]
MPLSAAPERPNTPLMKQYHSIKGRYPHAIVFFRLGDFYEMFGDDAKTASAALSLVLTARQSFPMCGIPAHAAQSYIAKLLRAGFKIAVAEQTSDPAKSKGLVTREVVRLITPGTIVEDELLDAATSNYLVCVEWAQDPTYWGLACMEVSTGEFWATEVKGDKSCRQLESCLARLNPAEILLPPQISDSPEMQRIIGARPQSLTLPPAVPFEPFPEEALDLKFKNRPLAVKSALKARAYIRDNEPQIQWNTLPKYLDLHGYVHLDESAIRTLELVSSSRGERASSLWGVLDRTQCAMGSRKLKEWILHPLTSLEEIRRRQNCVEELKESIPARRKLREILQGIPDLERIFSRLTRSSASPKELASLRGALHKLPRLAHWLKHGAVAPSTLGAQSPGGTSAEARNGQDVSRSALTEAFRDLPDLTKRLDSLREILDRTLADEPPQKISDGQVIRDGVHAELDELRSLKKDSQKWLREFEAKERKRSQISSLKIGYNSVFGYYIEITKPHIHKVPAGYTRKQTLANTERFILPELKDMESKILGAEEKILRLESELFHELRQKATQHLATIQQLAGLLSELDVFGSLAEAAARYGYVKPKMNLSHNLIIEEGRHPAVERLIPNGTFVPNDLVMDPEKTQTLLLTGPNMSGKSTFLRQNAVLVLMAQMGSFVAAQSAEIGIVDKILTRIGFHDDLAHGDSTFMVEMKEVAAIMSSATPRSLVILDEVGRGTSTFDGISIAWAVLEHLQRLAAPEGAGPSGPKVLFATHYFELVQLSQSHPRIQNFNVEVREWKNPQGHTEIVFLHKISPGSADRSYGIHVAKLAGLPAECIARAKEILRHLEQGSSIAASDAGGGQETELTLPMFSESSVLQELKNLQPESLTPLQALQKITEWKKEILS